MLCKKCCFVLRGCGFCGAEVFWLTPTVIAAQPRIGVIGAGVPPLLGVTGDAPVSRFTGVRGGFPISPIGPILPLFLLQITPVTR